MVEDGINGFLVGSCDVDGLAERVTQIIANPAMRIRLGKAVCVKVEQDFTAQPVREFETLLLSFVDR